MFLFRQASMGVSDKFYHDWYNTVCVTDNVNRQAEVCAAAAGGNVGERQDRVY